MKTIHTLLLAGAGMLLAGTAHAQRPIPNAPRQSPTGVQAMNIGASNGPTNSTDPTPRSGNRNDSYVEQLGTVEFAAVKQTGSGATANLQQTTGANFSDAYQQQVTTGARQHAYIYQSASSSVASQYQMGSNNNAKISQGSGTDHHAFQDQTGTSHNAEIYQDNTKSYALQRQQGALNFSYTEQTNGSNWSTVDQNGSVNTALVRQN